MRILMLTNKMPYPPVDGGAIASFNMAKGFVDNGNDVSVLSMNTKKHYVEPHSIPANLSIKFYIVDVPAEIKPIPAFMNLMFSSKPYNAVRFINEDYRNKLIELLKTGDYEIIQIEGLYLAPYIKTIRKYSSAKISLRAHNIEHEIWERMIAGEKSYLKRVYLKILYRRLKKFELSFINKYDFLVPITERDADKFRDYGNKKSLMVSQTGIDASKLNNYKNKTEFPSIFHIGALDWAPNIEGLKWFFQNVWNDVISENPKLKIFIAGRNASPELQDYFKGIKNLVFRGEVNDAYEFMSKKSVMIVPLLSGSGMRIKIIEGMALGKAIISTKIGAEGINCINNKEILIADTKKEFLDAIKKVGSDKSFCENIGENAKEFIMKNFDNKAVTSQLVDFYKQEI